MATSTLRDNLVSWIGGAVAGIVLSKIADAMSSLFPFYFWLFIYPSLVGAFFLITRYVGIVFPVRLNKFLCVTGLVFFVFIFFTSYNTYFKRHYFVKVTYANYSVPNAEVEIDTEIGDRLHGKTDKDGIFSFSVNRLANKPTSASVNCPGYNQNKIYITDNVPPHVELTKKIEKVFIEKPEEVIYRGSDSDFKFLATLQTEDGRQANTDLVHNPLTVKLDSTPFPIDISTSLTSSIQGKIDKDIELGEHTFQVTTPTDTPIGNHTFNVAEKYKFQYFYDSGYTFSNKHLFKTNGGSLDVCINNKTTYSDLVLHDFFSLNKKQTFRLRYSYKRHDAKLTIKIGGRFKIAIGQFASGAISHDPNFPIINTRLELLTIQHETNRAIVKTIPFDGDISLNKDVDILIAYDPNESKNEAVFKFSISYTENDSNLKNLRPDTIRVPMSDLLKNGKCDLSIGCETPEQKTQAVVLTLKEIYFGILR